MGCLFIAAYTWSHLEDDATATNFSTYLTPRRAQDFQNWSGMVEFGARPPTTVYFFADL